MQQVTKVANITKTVALFPFVKLGNFFHRKSAFYIANQDTEFLARVEAHKAAGTDLASESTTNFLNDQWRGVAYRIVKARDEAVQAELKLGE